jgi:Fe-S-cluster containining protein
VPAAPIDAGPFAAWRRLLVAARDGQHTVDVPCGSCTACCRSSQFVHIGAEDTDALAHVPSALRFPAPGRPAGNFVLGYDEAGRCPMLVDDACSIYDHRPRACRTYDCRVFAATGVEPDASQPEIARQVARWRFDLSGSDDRAAWRAVRGSVPDDGLPLARALRALTAGGG